MLEFGPGVHVLRAALKQLNINKPVILLKPDEYIQLEIQAKSSTDWGHYGTNYNPGRFTWMDITFAREGL